MNRKFSKTKKKMRLILVDTNAELVKEWISYFGDMENVTIIESDIIPIIEQYPEAYIVSPANSFGDMQGGIDLVYYAHFGYQLEEKLQSKIIAEKYGELIVGDFVVVDRFIFAPTMRVPMNISYTVNVYLAFRAALIASLENNIDTIICPGLGTGIGRVSPNMCAKQMYAAYIAITSPRNHYDLYQMSKEHSEMLKID